MRNINNLRIWNQSYWQSCPAVLLGKILFITKREWSHQISQGSKQMVVWVFWFGSFFFFKENRDWRERTSGIYSSLGYSLTTKEFEVSSTVYLRGAASQVLQGASEIPGNKCLWTLPPAVSSSNGAEQHKARLFSATESGRTTQLDLSLPGEVTLERGLWRAAGKGRGWKASRCRLFAGGCYFGWQHHHLFGPLPHPTGAGREE